MNYWRLMSPHLDLAFITCPTTLEEFALLIIGLAVCRKKSRFQRWQQNNSTEYEWLASML